MGKAVQAQDLPAEGIGKGVGRKIETGRLGLKAKPAIVFGIAVDKEQIKAVMPKLVYACLHQG